MDETKSGQAKRKRQDKKEKPHKKIKKIKNDELVLSLAELNDDILDHIITNFLGASSLLNLLMTCSKFGTIIQYRYKNIARRTFPCRLDATDSVRDDMHKELKDIARIERAFDYHYNVRVVEVDENRDKNDRLQRRAVFQTFPSDPSKVLCLDTTRAQLIDFTLGTTHAIDMGAKVCDIAIASDHRVAFLMESGALLVYSVANPAHWSKIFVVDTKFIGGANVKWMSKHDCWLVLCGSDYRVYDNEGKLMKKVKHDDEYIRLLAVRDDGAEAVMLVFKRYEETGNTLNRIDLLTSESSTLLADIGQSGEELSELKFIAGTDWVAWQRSGTEMFAQFMYNLKTEERYWTPTICGPTLSHGGTMLLENCRDHLVVRDLYKEKTIKIDLAGSHCMHAAWTYLPHQGHLNERIIASVINDDMSASLCILKPAEESEVIKVRTQTSSGKDSLGNTAYCWLGNIVRSAGVHHWELVHSLAEGRTLVLRDPFGDSGFSIIWNLY